MTTQSENLAKFFSGSHASDKTKPATREEIEAALLKCAFLQVDLSLSQLECALIRQKLERMLAAAGGGPARLGAKRIETMDDLAVALTRGSTKTA